MRASLPSRARPIGRLHPIQRIQHELLDIFETLGFEVADGPDIDFHENCFDKLGFPPDHPARDMQDTFYIAKPDRARLPDEGLVRRVQAAHEDGGDTSSTGWRYRWNGELAHKPVLRTHTTAATIR